MNIFVLDLDQESCVRQYKNQHVCKMTLETAQILCTAHHKIGTYDADEIPYRMTHENHPCCKWACESLSNYFWLWQLGIELCKEYTFRYGKVYKTQRDGHFEWLGNNIPDIEKEGMTEFSLCMPDKYKIAGDTIQSYRNFYIGDKAFDKKGRSAKWKNRNIPQWFLDARPNFESNYDN